MNKKVIKSQLYPCFRKVFKFRKFAAWFCALSKEYQSIQLIVTQLSLPLSQIATAEVFFIVFQRQNSPRGNAF